MAGAGTWYLGLCPSYFEIHQVPGTVLEYRQAASCGLRVV